MQKIFSAHQSIVGENGGLPCQRQRGILQILWGILLTIVLCPIGPAIAQDSENESGQSNAPTTQLSRARKLEIRRTIEQLQAQHMPHRDPSPWPKDLENAFWERAYRYFDRFHQAGPVRTWNDSEKRTYAELIAAAIFGDPQNQRLALERLQVEDAQAKTDHAHTEGIDYYWCFTLKQQIRKYFLLGDRLNPAYRDRMKQGAQRWTATDPIPRFELIRALDSPDASTRISALTLLQQLTRQNFGLDVTQWLNWWRPWHRVPWQKLEEAERQLNILPHPFYGRGKGGIGIKEQWGPDVRGSWVDGRNTTNLRLMRDTSIYLMAEETGQERTRLLYKDKIRFFVWQLYQIGMGEWDSENYLPHSLTPLLNLHDFAKDREVHQLAKAGLDWLLMAGALKYYRGGFGGPTLRDFGGASHVFGSSASHPLYLYFGESPRTDPAPRYDDIHTVTSRYRPPLAVVQLAHKTFRRPLELLNTKPNFDNWQAGNDEAPVYFETLFYGQSFYLGSVVSQGDNAGHPFKLLMENSQRGVDYFLANGTRRFHKPDPPIQIAQNRNLLLWLQPNDGKPTFLQLPQRTKPIFSQNIWWFPFERTYIALRPIALQKPQAIATAMGPQSNRYHQDTIWQAASQSKAPYVGFALEVVDAQDYLSFANFKNTIQSQQKLDLTKLSAGTVILLGSNTHRLSLSYNTTKGLPTIIRDGKPRDWQKEWAVYGFQSTPQVLPVHQDWDGGTLTLRPDRAFLKQTVTRSGQVTTSVTPQPEK
jgi:hypothetical protein